MSKILNNPKTYKTRSSMNQNKSTNTSTGGVRLDFKVDKQGYFNWNTNKRKGRIVK